MANPAHEALLRRGLDHWNQWRRDNPNAFPDLTGIAMAAANLSGANLSRAELRRATLIRTRLDRSDLSRADLREAQLHEVDLTGADLSGANLERAALPGAKLRGTRLVGANLRGAQITVADFRGADLREADLTGSDLRESIGAGATFEGARLGEAELMGCRLPQASLLGASGLSFGQLQSAMVDETTTLPESFPGGASDSALDSLVRRIERMRSRARDGAVLKDEIARYDALLDELQARGIDTAPGRISDEELHRPLAAIFLERLDRIESLLERLRSQDR